MQSPKTNPNKRATSDQTFRRADRSAEPPRLHALTADRERAEVWADFRRDRELIERLRITPDEIDALENCALLGTLTSKQDLLFILRQIREATGSLAEQPVLAADLDGSRFKRAESTESGARKLNSATAPKLGNAPLFSSMNGVLQRRSTEQVLVLISAIVASTGLLCALFAGFYVLSQRLFAGGSNELLDAPSVPGLGTFGFSAGVKSLVAAEIVFVVIFVLALSYGRWKAMRRLRSYRQRYAAD